MKYPSRYSPNKQVTAAQYIAELICEKKAKINGGGDLPIQFWKLPKWASFYRQQIVTANGLLRIYSASAIVAALKSNAAYNIFSLRAPHLDIIIKAEQSRLDLLEQRMANSADVERVDVNAKPRQPRTKQSIISKLKELENDGEER